MLEILPFTPLRDDYTALLDESLAQGQRMLQRLHDNWESGANRFDQNSEILIAGFINGALAGVCGRNIDPYGADAGQGRVRHLYVAQRFRRNGVGSALVRSILDGASEYFSCLNTNAPESAYAFYQALGFVRVTDNATVTHCYRFG
ncbi:GNAT family N-acetyltransferase [Pseudochrobactrum asaccharolyticum]|uniref:GNAT family N-acetyltransferase n=1 Tax=Pseudochrobactrum asaccharolyticum TaxID=354351 RepID=UPI0040427177